MATPAFRAVRQHLPQARITLVIRRRVEPIIRGTPWFDQVIVYSPGERNTPAEFLRCVARLRAERAELGLVLPNSFSSALMFLLGGVGRRIGYRRDCRSMLLSEAVPRPADDEGMFKPTYMVDYYLALCRQAGIPAAGREMELPFSESDASRSEQILRARGIGTEAPLFLMHPGAGYGPSKRWPAGRFARLAEMLVEQYGAQVALVAGPAEKKVIAAIRSAASVPVTDLCSCGIDLHLLKCVVARSGLLVTTDSGPRHYGVALGVPTVCVMGPTHPGYSTSGWPHDHVVRLDVECGPCQKKVCPLDHRCMEAIDAEMVFAACGNALEQARTEAHT